MADDINSNQADVKQGAEQARQGAEQFAQGAAGAAKGAAEQMRDTFNEHVTGPAMRAGEAMRQSGRKVAEGGSTISMRLIDQAETNAHEAFAAMRAAAGARDVSEIMKIQGDYLREQGQRAMAQAKEIGELIVQFGKDAVQPLKPGGDR